MMTNPKEILAAVSKLPPLYSSEHDLDPVARVKIFVPWGAATWYLWEYDPDARLAFGYCCLGLGMDELGYVDLDGIVALRGPGGITAEVDRNFAQTPISELRKMEEN